MALKKCETNIDHLFRHNLWLQKQILPTDLIDRNVSIHFNKSCIRAELKQRHWKVLDMRVYHHDILHYIFNFFQASCCKSCKMVLATIQSSKTFWLLKSISHSSYLFAVMKRKKIMQKTCLRVPKDAFPPST